MTTSRQFSLAPEALAELKAESASHHPKSIPAPPTLGEALAGIGPLPREVLFLGMAMDGLPVLLNLRDPIPGPMLVIGDSGVGKTVFLQSIARSIPQTHTSTDVQFGVITAHPDEWDGIEDTHHRVGIFPSHHHSAQDFMLSLASWAHTIKNARQSVLLLVDDLEAVANLDFDALQNFRWLLLRGPARRVWPIITLHAERYGQVLSWLSNFRTRIFGRIANPRVAEALGADKSSGVDRLEARSQFSLRENGGWIQFWLPNF